MFLLQVRDFLTRAGESDVVKISGKVHFDVSSWMKYVAIDTVVSLLYGKYR